MIFLRLGSSRTRAQEAKALDRCLATAYKLFAIAHGRLNLHGTRRATGPTSPDADDVWRGSTKPLGGQAQHLAPLLIRRLHARPRHMDAEPTGSGNSIQIIVDDESDHAELYELSRCNLADDDDEA